MSTFTTEMDAAGYPVRIIVHTLEYDEIQVNVYTDFNEGGTQKPMFSGSLDELDKHRLILSCVDRKLDSIKHTIYEGWKSQ